jgi:hypothetical protein
MALKYGKFKWRKMRGNRKCDLQWTPYFTYEQRRNTKVNIVSHHELFQMREIIQYTMTLMPVDTFGGQSSHNLKGILASRWKIHLSTTSLTLQTTSSCSGSFWQNTAHRCNEVRNVKICQRFRPLPYHQNPTTVNALPRYTTQLTHSKLKILILKWAFSNSDLTEHIPLCL